MYNINMCIFIFYIYMYIYKMDSNIRGHSALYCWNILKYFFQQGTLVSLSSVYLFTY